MISYRMEKYKAPSIIVIKGGRKRSRNAMRTTRIPVSAQCVAAALVLPTPSYGVCRWNKI